MFSINRGSLIGVKVLGRIENHMVVINHQICFLSPNSNNGAFTHAKRNDSFSLAESTDMLGLYIATSPLTLRQVKQTTHKDYLVFYCWPLKLTFVFIVQLYHKSERPSSLSPVHHAHFS